MKVIGQGGGQIMTAAPFGSYTAQAWRDQKLITAINGLSIDAAREICRAHLMAGLTGRVWLEGGDYCEVYTPGRPVRCGTFGDTTLVRIIKDDGPPLPNGERP